VLGWGGKKDGPEVIKTWESKGKRGDTGRRGWGEPGGGGEHASIESDSRWLQDEKKKPKDEEGR